MNTNTPAFRAFCEAHSLNHLVCEAGTVDDKRGAPRILISVPWVDQWATAHILRACRVAGEVTSRAAAWRGEGEDACEARASVIINAARQRAAGVVEYCGELMMRHNVDGAYADKLARMDDALAASAPRPNCTHGPLWGRAMAHTHRVTREVCWGSGAARRYATSAGECAAAGLATYAPQGTQRPCVEGDWTRAALTPYGGPVVRRADSGAYDYAARKRIGVCGRRPLASGWRCD